MGVFRHFCTRLCRRLVFPTHVGVFPRAQIETSYPESSPRTWGCFPSGREPFRHGLVFLTHVGVFLPPMGHLSASPRLPHARGGVSTDILQGTRELRSSPRTWGCFSSMRILSQIHLVFPTHVGVFLRRWPPQFPRNCLPHARGGVSLIPMTSCARRPSSPRTWGCFWRSAASIVLSSVFPTHVGVFLGRCSMAGPIYRLPHARGGVSERDARRSYNLPSSPRTWGCFCLIHIGSLTEEVFPTHVGVFLRFTGRVNPHRRLPHARGGVS